MMIHAIPVYIFIINSQYFSPIKPILNIESDGIWAPKTEYPYFANQNLNVTIIVQRGSY